jgi:hypothetical protein
MIGLVLCLTAAANSNPGIAPPNSSSHGQTYAEWNALWWRWFISLPLDKNPSYGADCSNGQLGSVWFLAAPGGTTATVNCNVPNGKALFFPVINTECSNLESAPFFGATEADRRACAKKIMDGATGLSATIDGVPVQDLNSYRSSSPNFSFVAPDNNVLFVPAGSGQSVGDGVYLLLNPMSTGKHTIHITGMFPAFSFFIDTTFNITVGH